MWSNDKMGEKKKFIRDSVYGDISLNDFEVRVMDMQHINWFKKGGSFLIAKFTNKRYEKSF